MKKNNLKHAIVQASFKMFSKADYRKVSTNDIVKEASVSKGLLFHYFKNKKSLYMTLYETAWTVIHRDIFSDFPFENRDVFERLKLMIIRKTKSLQLHPTLTAFIKRVHLNTQPDISKLRSQIYHDFQQKNYQRIFENIDKSLFKYPVFHDEILKVSTWAFNKVTNDWEKMHHSKDKDVDKALKILDNELSNYVEFFKQYFYHA